MNVSLSALESQKLSNVLNPAVQLCRCGDRNISAPARLPINSLSVQHPLKAQIVVFIILFLHRLSSNMQGFWLALEVLVCVC